MSHEFDPLQFAKDHGYWTREDGTSGWDLGSPMSPEASARESSLYDEPPRYQICKLEAFARLYLPEYMVAWRNYHSTCIYWGTHPDAEATLNCWATDLLHLVEDAGRPEPGHFKDIVALGPNGLAFLSTLALAKVEIYPVVAKSGWPYFYKTLAIFAEKNSTQGSNGNGSNFAKLADDSFSAIAIALRGRISPLDFSNIARDESKSIAKVWTICQLPECEEERDLKACVRCQRVRYCSEKHQKKDWAEHKKMCRESLWVAAITTLAEFKEITGGDKIVVIDFWATWCGPCKAISPVFEKLESMFPTLGFYKVDVDSVEEVSQECGIKAMPTFLFFKNGEKIGQVVGADPNKLKQALQLQSEA